MAEQLNRLSAPRNVDEHARLQPDALEGGAIVAQRNFILGTAVYELEYSLRQPAPRDFAQIGDVISP